MRTSLLEAAVREERGVFATGSVTAVATWAAGRKRGVGCVVVEAG